MLKIHTLVGLIAALALVGCGEERTTPREAPEAPPPTTTGTTAGGGGPQSDTPLAERMQEHFVGAAEARDAIVRGDADAARAALRTLAELHPTASYPPSWTPQLAPFRAVAARAASASDLDGLALGVGQLANACAHCHSAVGAELDFDESMTPPSGTDPASHMQRHQWAADRMWEALMAPADDRYSAGAGALVEAPLEPTNIAANQTAAPEVVALAERVHALGRNATAATDAAQRAQFYGEFLSTCASCHQQIPGAPGSASAVQ